jgi:DNA ligase (NAD+)
MSAVAAVLFHIPDTCPVCGGPTTVEGQFLYCRSRSCPIQLTGSVKVWVNRLGLLHWGDALIDSLTNPDKPAISSIADLYSLDPEEIAGHCSGLKFAQKCYNVLHANKSITLDLLIASLNIPNLANATASDIVSAGHDTVEKILDLTVEKLILVPNIGEVTAKQIYDGIQERRTAIMDLAKVLDIKVSTGPLSGSSFCITGATSKPRKAIEKMILDAGGSAKGSVGAGTTYLVTNDPDTGSSKMRNAKKYGTKVISEVELHKMMNP